METDPGEPAPRWLSDEEQRAWRTHLAVSKLLMHRLERDLQPFGLTMNDYEILVNLSESAGHRMRMSDLAAATLQSKSRLSHQITRMERAGLVRREHCDSDKRGLFAALTEHGWATMREVAPHHVASVRRHFVDLLSEEDLAALHRSLDPVAEHLREGHAPARPTERREPGAPAGEAGPAPGPAAQPGRDAA